MKSHIDRSDGVRPTMRFHVGMLPTRKLKPTICGPEPLVEPPVQQPTADDWVMVTACYEAHLNLEKMLSVFAELRGDDAEETSG